MKHLPKKLTAILLAAALLAALAAVAPLTAAAETGGLTIIAASNLFPTQQTTITDWPSYTDQKNNVYVTVDYTICADKYLLGIELDELTWDPNVLEYKESYNMVPTPRGETLDLFPFTIEEDCGRGIYNTFGDDNGGRLVGNFSSVSPPAYAANEEDGGPIVAVRARFRVKDRTAGTTTVTCNLEALSLCDTDYAALKPQYLPVNHIVEPDAQSMADFGTSVQPDYPLPFVAGKTLTVDSGEIGINFFLSIKDPSLDIGALKATFAWGEGNYATEAEDTTVEFNSNQGFHFVSCRVAAPCMTDKVTMRLWNGDTELLSQRYAVVDYVTSIKDTPYYTSRSKLMNLLCDMLDYGGATQLHFNYRTDDLASAYIALLNTENTALNGNWERRKLTENMTDTTDMSSLRDTFGMAYSGCSMSTEAKVKLNVYFTVRNADTFAQTHAYCNGRELTFIDAGSDTKILQITDIKADKIFDGNTLTFRNGDASADRTFSAARYFNLVKNGSNYTAEHKTVMQTMNNYANSTAAYVS